MANRSTRGAQESRGRDRHFQQNPGLNCPSGEASTAHSASPGGIPVQNSGQGRWLALREWWRRWQRILLGMWWKRTGLLFGQSTEFRSCDNDSSSSQGDIADEFHTTVSNHTTEITGSTLAQPDLKILNGNCIFSHREDGQLDMLDQKIHEGKQIDRWAILEFTPRWHQLNVDQFIENIVERAAKVGVHMNPRFLFHEQSSINVLANDKQLYNSIKHVNGRSEGKLQILFCPMESFEPGFNTLKQICETEIGIVTQCFLTTHANQGKDEDYLRLACEIKTKLER